MNKLETKIWKYQYTSKEEGEDYIEFIDFVVDGIPLNTIFSSYSLIPNYCFGSKAHQEKTLDKLIGKSNYMTAVYLFVCPYCSDQECGRIVVDVLKENEYIVWKNFRYISSDNYNTFKIGPFYFNSEDCTKIITSISGRLGYEWTWDLMK